MLAPLPSLIMRTELITAPRGSPRTSSRTGPDMGSLIMQPGGSVSDFLGFSQSSNGLRGDECLTELLGDPSRSGVLMAWGQMGCLPNGGQTHQPDGAMVAGIDRGDLAQPRHRPAGAAVINHV